MGCSGDGEWSWLQNNVNVLNATKGESSTVKHYLILLLSNCAAIKGTNHRTLSPVSGS